MIGLFKKKTPKEWKFDDKPIVYWTASNKVKYDMTVFCKIALSQILNIKDATLTVVTRDELITNFDSNDLEFQALLQGNPDLHQYRLVLHSRIFAGELAPIVCHELIHLKQYEKGELKLVKGGATWKGKFYEKETPYDERPWEQEANAEMYKLERKVKDLYYEK